MSLDDQRFKAATLQRLCLHLNGLVRLALQLLRKEFQE